VPVRTQRARDIPVRVLEIGLAVLLVLAPLPFGAVGARGRLLIETGALLLLLVWMGRALFRDTPLPPRWVSIGIVGMLCLGTVQLLPLGDAVVSVLSPRSVAIRAESQPPQDAARAEERLLGLPPSDLDLTSSISLDPGATASAVRSGCALAALLLIATTVTALRGARTIALALLISAAFQGLYGLLVVASGHDRIWHLPKQHFLDNATGTFVNRNHYANLLAMSLAVGAALIISELERRAARGGRAAPGLVRLFGPERGSSLVLGLLLIVGLAGLLLSFSRAGIATGLLAVVLVFLIAGRARRPRTRLLVVVLIVAAALLPLWQIGADRLIARFELAGEHFVAPTGRATVWLDTVAMFPDFPVVGCGYGTFAATYPIYRSADVRKFFSNAHNDTLEALVEGGTIGMIFLLMTLVPILRRTIRTLGGAKGTLAVGFAAGLAAMCLHSVVAFTFHIPSNAATAVVLAGAVLGLPWLNRN